MVKPTCLPACLPVVSRGPQGLEVDGEVCWEGNRWRDGIWGRRAERDVVRTELGGGAKQQADGSSQQLGLAVLEQVCEIVVLQ